MLCEDPDAPGGTWYHWAAYDIAATQTSLPADASRNAPKLRFKQAVNDFQKPGYGGPCPPPGEPHHYHFRLLALSVAQLPISEGVPYARVASEARKHVIAEATLVGIFRR